MSFGAWSGPWVFCCVLSPIFDHPNSFANTYCVRKLASGLRNSPLEHGVSHQQASSRAKMAGTMSEKVEQRLPVSVDALRVESYSATDDSIVILLRPKYSTAERAYSIPVECLQDLIVGLRQLSYLHPQWRLKKPTGRTESLLPLEPPVAVD